MTQGTRTTGPLRVLHATECLAAGTLQVMRTLTAVLAARGAEQTVVYSVRDESPSDVAGLFPAGVRLVQVPRAQGLHGAFITGMVRALRQQCHDWQPQHLHLHSSKAGFVGRLALRGLAGGPRVYYSPHGLSCLDPARPLANLAFRWMERLADAPGVVPVACGRGEADLLAQLTGRPAVVLDNPVDDHFFGVPALQRAGGLVATVGRISRQKSPEAFAAVARQLLPANPGLRMVWVGDGDPAGRALLELAGCEVTGWVDRNRVAEVMAQTDVYLQTSLWEGMPLSVLQALAAGIPCVVSDVVGNRDAVRHGHTGYVATDPDGLAQAIRVLLGDAGLRSSIGMQARADALQRFSQAAFASRVEQLYGLASLAPPQRAAAATGLPLGALGVRGVR